jgi:hypothetical protein
MQVVAVACVMKGYFEMTGNSIVTNNTAVTGGVSNSGSFVMLDNSRITNNTAGSIGGSGVLNEGSFEIANNAVISGNAVMDKGGGVYIRYGGFFKMTGGVIISNTADTGGGVYVGEEVNGEECVFEMSGGAISGNFATGDYGGVYNLGTFNQTGGTITENKTNGKHPNQ